VLRDDTRLDADGRGEAAERDRRETGRERDLLRGVVDLDLSPASGATAYVTSSWPRF